MPHTAHGIDKPSVEPRASCAPAWIFPLQDGRGLAETAALPDPKRISCRIQVLPCLHFDEGQQPVPLGCDIDFTGCCSHAPAMYGPSTGG